jgi:hypothetical protein
MYLEGTLFLRNILVDMEGTLFLLIALLEKSKDLLPTILGVGRVLGSLMQEYHHVGAYPTHSHQTDIKVGHLIKRMARSSPATTSRSLAKLGWQLPMSLFEFSIQHE